MATGNKDLVQRISKLGSWRKHKQNCERDLQFAVRAFARALKANVIEGPVRMWDPGENAIVVTQMSFIDPVALATALFAKGPHIFRKCFFGDLSEEEVLAYWQNAATRCEWFMKSHAATWDAGALRKLAPVSLYGDDVSNYRNTEAGNISIIAFTSDMARGNPPFLRYFLLSLYSEYQSCVHTYDDLMDTWLCQILGGS